MNPKDIAIAVIIEALRSQPNATLREVFAFAAKAGAQGRVVMGLSISQLRGDQGLVDAAVLRVLNQQPQPVTSALIVAQTGHPVAVVRAALGRLREEGSATVEGHGRGTRYVAAARRMPARLRDRVDAVS